MNIKKPKSITIFFDFEVGWGAPYKVSEIESIIGRILSILVKYNTKAVFNTCGAIVESHPKLIRSIFDAGHELASHGYKHEDFRRINILEANNLLDRINKIFKKVIGKNSIGMRFPYSYSNHNLYTLLEDKGYKW